MSTFNFIFAVLCLIPAFLNLKNGDSQMAGVWFMFSSIEFALSSIRSMI